MDTIQKIAKDIEDASAIKNRSAMFHCAVLVHADELRGIDPHEFCKEVGVADSYATEFHKMLKVAEMLHHLGLEIKPK